MQVLADDPSLSVTEVTKVLGARWKELSAEQRLPYEDLGKADRERYCDNIVEFLDSLYVCVLLMTASPRLHVSHI